MFRTIRDIFERVVSTIRQPFVRLKESRYAMEAASIARALVEQTGTVGWTVGWATKPWSLYVFNRYSSGAEPLSIFAARNDKGWKVALYDHRYDPYDIDSLLVSEEGIPYRRALVVIPTLARVMVSSNTAYWEFLQKQEEQRLRQEFVDQYDPFAEDEGPNEAPDKAPIRPSEITN